MNSDTMSLYEPLETTESKINFICEPIEVLFKAFGQGLMQNLEPGNHEIVIRNAFEETRERAEACGIEFSNTSTELNNDQQL